MSSKQRIVIFRADASARIGGGHVVRSLALADGLAENGWRCIFACRPDTVKTVPVLEHSGYDLIELQTEEEAGEVTDKLNCQADLLVVDHYERDAEFHRACRRWADKILVIDELADRQFDCDILLDQTLDRCAEDYEGLVSSDCHLLLGPVYSLLRPEFSELRYESLKRRQKNVGIKKLLVSFGAVDAHNLTGLVLEVLQKAECKAEIDIILGASAVHANAVRELAAKSSCQILLHNQVNDMAALMAQADLAIGAAGMSTWERCCLGLPTLVITEADNQMLNADRLHAAGGSISLGLVNVVNSKIISEAYEHVNNDIAVLRNMAIVAASVCDGGGVNRIIEKLEN